MWVLLRGLEVVMLLMMRKRMMIEMVMGVL